MKKIALLFLQNQKAIIACLETWETTTRTRFETVMLDVMVAMKDNFQRQSVSLAEKERLDMKHLKASQVSGLNAILSGEIAMLNTVSYRQLLVEAGKSKPVVGPACLQQQLNLFDILFYNTLPGRIAGINDE